MSRQATSIGLRPDERKQLLGMIRLPKAQARYVERARMILRAAQGESNVQIASALNTRPARVSKWRVRFESEGISGLHDDLRVGRPPVLDEAEFTSRLLAQIDEKPPEGHARWDGTLLAKVLQVSADRIWRVLRALGINLKRRQSWCISTDPQFAEKAADVVGMYLAPPENAVVLSFDEKPCIQALERAQGWLKLPNGRALTGFAHEYKRHGTTTLFAALNTVTGEVLAGHYKRRRRIEFLDFMDRIVAAHPGKEIHVILDNLSTHRIAKEKWAKAHPEVTFHFTPTHASWLNQIEIWFSILSRKPLRGASFRSVKELIGAIDAFIAAYNQTAAPFEWTKANVRAKTLDAKYGNFCG